MFLVRDMRLTAARPRLAIAFACFAVSSATVCGAVAERLSAAEAQAWLADPRCWITAVGVHAALAFRSGRRALRGLSADWLSVFPAPVWMIAIVGASRTALTWLAWPTGPEVGALLGVGYSLLAVSAGLALRARCRPSATLRFASATHGSALLLVPAAVALHRPSAPTAIDWGISAAVLSLVATLVAASFAWHRYGRH